LATNKEADFQLSSIKEKTIFTIVLSTLKTSY